MKRIALTVAAVFSLCSINAQWSANGGNVITDGNVGIGTTTPDSKLAVNGTVHAQEVRVDLEGWPDYVFESTFNLMSLKDVENYIIQNKHLPGVPSANLIETDGLNLGKLMTIQMQKIEELTLYTIEQEKKLKKQNNVLKASQKATQKSNESVRELEARLDKLEALVEGYIKIKISLF